MNLLSQNIVNFITLFSGVNISIFGITTTTTTLWGC